MTDKRKQIDKAYLLQKEYGQDSLNYLSLTEEYEFFFGTRVQGYIAYLPKGRKVLSMGDPVCAGADTKALIEEYLGFCDGQGKKPIFVALSEETIKTAQEAGLRIMKCGEEAVLNLSEYTLAGGSRAVLRRSVNKGDKSGVLMQEYKPQIHRDKGLEAEIWELSRKWYEDKQRQINFAVGTIDFDHPYDRRFFLTRDANGKLLTFLSFLPYEYGRKLCIDLMHREMDAPTGSMEHAIISVARKVQEEGVEEISLSFAPLVGMDTGKEKMTIAERLLNAIFQKMDAGYHFKKLYQFKKKFAPSEWKPRYIAYSRKISKVNLAMTVSGVMLGTVDLILYAKYKFFLMGELFKIKWEFITGGKRNDHQRSN